MAGTRSIWSRTSGLPTLLHPKGARCAPEFFSRLRFFAAYDRINNAPDGIRTVVGEEQRTVWSYRDTDRASPHLAVVEDEARDEIFVLAAGPSSLVQGDADHFVAGADGTVPR